MDTQRRPLRREIGYLGDSKVDYGFSSYNSGATIVNRTNGAQTWMAAASDGRVVVPMAYSKGYAGKTSAQINALAKDALALPIDILSILYGANDRRNGTTVAQSWNNLLDLVDMCLCKGIIPLVTSEVPKGPGSLALTQAQQEDHWQFHLKIDRELRAIYSEALVASPWNDIQDLGNTDRWPKPGMMWADGGHPAGLAAQIIGYSQWDAIKHLFPRPGRFVTSNDQYNPDTHAAGSLVQNSLFLVPGGAFQQSSAKNTSDSVLGNAWSAFGDQGGPAGIESSWWIESGAPVGNWQCIRFRGRTTKENAQIMFTQNVPLASLATGDKVVAKCRTRQEGVGTTGPSLSLLVNGANNLEDCSLADGFFQMTPNPLAGSRETPVYVHPSTGTTELKLRLVVPIAANVDVDFTVKVAQLEAVKLIA